MSFYLPIPASDIPKYLYLVMMTTSAGLLELHMFQLSALRSFILSFLIKYSLKTLDTWLSIWWLVSGNGPVPATLWECASLLDSGAYSEIHLIIWGSVDLLVLSLVYSSSFVEVVTTLLVLVCMCLNCETYSTDILAHCMFFTAI